MSDATTKRMIEAYLEQSMAPMFLTSFFRTPPENYHRSEKVEVDIEREGEELAVVLTDLSQGPRYNESTKLTNKEFTPPIFDEAGTLNGFDLLKREAGEHPFMDPNYAANAARRAFRIFRKIELKVRRAIEQMASQVLQTGTLTLVDKDGNSLYTLDFQPKASHFPTVSDSWGTASATPLDDLASLARVIKRDGKVRPNLLLMGESSFDNFIRDDAVKDQFDNRRYELGNIAPQAMDEYANRQGHVWIGNYRFEMWTYDGFYVDPQTGDQVNYIDENKVIMLGTGSRLDLTFGAIPQAVAPDPRLTGFVMPGRIAGPDAGIDLTTNAWITDDNRSLKVSAGTRPLTIPTGIDTFGCLTTTV
jgi:hypothetical protein